MSRGGGSSRKGKSVGSILKGISIADLEASTDRFFLPITMAVTLCVESDFFYDGTMVSLHIL